MLRALAVVASIALSAGAAPAVSYACRCTGPQPGPAAARRADAVLVGRVVEIHHDNPRRAHKATAVVLEVARVLKGGEGAARVTIDLGNHSCAITWWKQDETWVVFAKRGEDGTLSTRQCTGTMRVAKPGGSIAPDMARRLDRIASPPSP